MKQKKEDGFNSGLVLGILIMGLIIVLWSFWINPSIKSSIERTETAKEECYDKGLSYVDYKCKTIDVSNTSIRKYEKRCYAICGYNI